MLTSPRILIPLPLAFLLAVSCSPETTQASTPSASYQASATAIEPAATSDLPRFVSGVDNPLFPLPLGRRLIYRGSDESEPVLDITDVTREHKTILGVQVVTVLDWLFKHGQLTEKTFD